MFLPEREREFVYYHKHKTDGRNVNEVKFIISSNFLIHISITGKCHKITIKEMNSSIFFLFRMKTNECILSYHSER